MTTVTYYMAIIVIKIKSKDLAKLISRSPRYTRTLLHRKGIKLQQFDIDRVIDLIIRYRTGPRDFRHKRKDADFGG